MLQQREQESARTIREEYYHALPVSTTETPHEEAPKAQGWHALYEEYVTNNPVFWKESKRPDLSALSPKIRAKALANREKREAATRPAWRNLMDSLMGAVIFSVTLWAVSQFLTSLKMPLYTLYFCPFFGTLGMGAALTRNIILEREKRTWDALLLSNLTPAQILLGKFLPWLRQIAWVAASMVIFVLPALLQGTVPLLSLVVAVPLILTSPLPGGMMALEVGLHAKSMSNGMGRTNKLVMLPMLANLLAGGLGFIGMLALQAPFPFSAITLPAWLSLLLVVPWLMMAVNLAWTRGLWRRMLRNFHKAPSDFSG